MGILSVSALANIHSQLSIKYEELLQSQFDRHGPDIAFPGSHKYFSQHVEDVILLWSSIKDSHHPPTSRQITEVLRDVSLLEMIGMYNMKGMDRVSTFNLIGGSSQYFFLIAARVLWIIAVDNNMIFCCATYLYFMLL